jgi:hypothetical protein
MVDEGRLGVEPGSVSMEQVEHRLVVREETWVVKEDSIVVSSGQESSQALHVEVVAGCRSVGDEVGFEDV